MRFNLKEKIKMYWNVLYTSIWGMFNHLKAVEGKNEK